MSELHLITGVTCRSDFGLWVAHPNAPACAEANPKLSHREDERKILDSFIWWAVLGGEGGESGSGMGGFGGKARANHEKRPEDWFLKNI